MSRLDPERSFMLLCAAVPTRRKGLAAKALLLAQELDWSRLRELMTARRLLATLGPCALEIAGEHGSDDFAQAVGTAIEAGRRQAALLQLVCERTRAALAEEGIASVPLKGPSLSEALYGDPGRRSSSDVDLLVAGERLQDAVAVARRLGYAAPSDPVGADGMPLLHYALGHEREQLPPIELHWRIHWYETRFARERLLRAGAVRRARPVDELAALLLFYARDGFIDLRAVSDLSAWWRCYGAQLPAGAFAGLLREYPALARALEAALAAAERVAGLPAAQILGRSPRLDCRACAAVRLANPHLQGSESQIYADMGLVDGLLAPPGGLRAFLSRQLAAPAHRTRTLARYGRSAARALTLPKALRPAVAP